MNDNEGVSCSDCGTAWGKNDTECPNCGSVHRSMGLSFTTHEYVGSSVKMQAIVYSKKAVKVINRLDVPTKQRIKKGVEKIPDGDIEPFQGSDGDYRLRIGDWRIIFTYEDSDTVRVKKIGPRGGVYK